MMNAVLIVHLAPYGAVFPASHTADSLSLRIA
jgi:hypothetical protein